MAVEARFRFGHATVEVIAKGCVQCGAEFSHKWRPAKKVSVRIGAHEAEVTLWICGHCLERGGGSLLV